MAICIRAHTFMRKCGSKIAMSHGRSASSIQPYTLSRYRRHFLSCSSPQSPDHHHHVVPSYTSRLAISPTADHLSIPTRPRCSSRNTGNTGTPHPLEWALSFLHPFNGICAEIGILDEEDSVVCEAGGCRKGNGRKGQAEDEPRRREDQEEVIPEVSRDRRGKGDVGRQDRHRVSWDCEFPEKNDRMLRNSLLVRNDCQTRSGICRPVNQDNFEPFTGRDVKESFHARV